uniref:Uncharacterized protein n=1 Tax=Fagus sylvatica TaxID=28930 RepID=A0A2N9IC08_FAGSY
MPTPLATPRRREPPHGQACRQALPCPIPTVWRSPIRADLGLDERDPPHGQALPCLIPTVWRSPIRADLGLASPSSPNEFELAKKGSPEVELGLEVVEPCRLVAEILNFGC